MDAKYNLYMLGYRTISFSSLRGNGDWKGRSAFAYADEGGGVVGGASPRTVRRLLNYISAPSRFEQIIREDALVRIPRYLITFDYP